PFAGTELDPTQKMATTIHIYDVAGGKERKQIRFETSSIFGSRLAFSPNGKTLALGSTLYDAASGKQIRKLEGSSGGIFTNGMTMSVGAPVFSPAGNILALTDISTPLRSTSLLLSHTAREQMLRQL